jgi:hypothetical protein
VDKSSEIYTTLSAKMRKDDQAVVHMYLTTTKRMVVEMISAVPFVQMAVVGVLSHVIERKVERAGHGGKVVFIRLVTYVVYGLITMYQWRDLFHYAVRIFDL